MKYRVVYEYSAPTFYDYDTDDELYDECQASIQCYWVVSYDEKNREIIEWVDRFYDVENAKKYIEKLEQGE